MKSATLTNLKDSKLEQRLSAEVEEKLFPGPPLDASVFAKKFQAANEAGRAIKGFKKAKSNPGKPSLSGK